MSNSFYAILFAVGFGTWVYSRFVHYTNSQRNSLIGAGVAALLGFFVIFTLLNMISGK